MSLKPILSALLRNKAGAVLISLQIALTLAIICNALFIIQQRLSYIDRPSGLQESALFTFANLWVGPRDGMNIPDRIARDLQTIRSTPGVIDAVRSNSYPLRGGGWSTGLQTQQGPDQQRVMSTQYMVDDHALATYGLHLVAGRNFTAGEIENLDMQGNPAPKVVIVTQSVADALYPDGDALGKPLYVSDSVPPSTIIGIVERMQTPWVGFSWADTFYNNSTLVPFQMMAPFGHIIARAEPGRREAVMKDVEQRLLASDRMRVILAMRSFDEVRANAYRSDRGMAILMSVICGVLLLVTAAGIVGLANFWVGQRHRQIGIRRALGARRRDILRYFQIENLMISLVGVVIGIAAAILLNLWLVTHYEMARLSLLYILVAAVLVLALGQLAVLQPARRASRVPPMVATREA